MYRREAGMTKIRVCLVGLWLLEKLLWALSFWKAAVGCGLWETQKSFGWSLVPFGKKTERIPKVSESRGWGAFGFVLREKLLLGKSTCGFWALWLAFGFYKSKSRFKSPTKGTLRLACRKVGGDQWKGLIRQEQENKIFLQILTQEWDSFNKKAG